MLISNHERQNIWDEMRQIPFYYPHLDVMNVSCIYPFFLTVEQKHD